MCGRTSIGGHARTVGTQGARQARPGHQPHVGLEFHLWECVVGQAHFELLLQFAHPREREPFIRVQKSPYRSPNTVAYVERFIQTQHQQCLDYFIMFGPQHINHLVCEMVDCYHEERPHQSKDNRPLSAPGDESVTDAIVPLSRIGCRNRLGGLLKHYYRKARSRTLQALARCSTIPGDAARTHRRQGFGSLALSPTPCISAAISSCLMSN